MEELDKSQVQKAVEALISLQKAPKTKAQFLDTPEKIWLQFAFKKVPQLTNKTIKLNLPHGLATDNLFVCLFVKDLDRGANDHEETVRHFQQLLDDQGITQISEIIPLRALKTMYKAFEAKRNLSNSFDLYLADERIIRLLPAQLSKHFYQRKRHPVQVNLKASDLKKEIFRALNNSRVILTGRGSACSAYVAHSKLSAQETTENVIAAASQIASAIPGGLQNVRSFYIKTETSTALPVYLSMGSANDVNLPVEKKIQEVIEPEEVTTVLHGKVRVFPSGRVQVVNKSTERRRKRRSDESEKKKQLGGGESTEKSSLQESEEPEMEPAKKRKTVNAKNLKSKPTSVIKTRKEGKHKIVTKNNQKKIQQSVAKASTRSSAKNPKAKKFKSK